MTIRSQLVQRAATEVLSLDLDHPVRVGVDGFCAAGKTTIADELAAVLTEAGIAVIRVSTDDFQNPPKIRWQLGENSPEGFYRHAVDFEAVQREVLFPLGPDGSRLYRVSSYDIHARRANLSERSTAPDHAVLVMDGLFLHTDPVIGSFDYSIFVEAPFEACVSRARERNQERMGSAEEVERHYRSRYIPGFKLYLSECRPGEKASVTIQNGGTEPDRREEQDLSGHSPEMR